MRPPIGSIRIRPRGLRCSMTASLNRIGVRSNGRTEASQRRPAGSARAQYVLDTASLRILTR
jgi:hypothetical protein